MANLNIKKGDKVMVIAGKDKGSVNTVLSTSPKHNKVLVDNVNVVSKHKKPRSAQDKGGIIKKPAPIDASNVLVVCPECKKATRIAHREEGDKKVRVCKKCGAVLDKKYVKETKKSEKKSVKAKEKTTTKKEKVVKEEALATSEE